MASHTDIERQLYTIFTDHPNSHVNESGEPVIPADALVDVFRSFSDVSNVPLLSEEETDMLKALLASNPGLEVTPSILLQFIAEKTRHSPSPSPPDNDDVNNNDDELLPTRGRDQERQLSLSSSQSSPSSSDYHRHRSLSDGSSDGHYYTGSRPSSRGPLPPQTPYNNKSSIFDAERRQRSTPLANAAPSSWGSKRPAPAARRRSVDGGNRSDSEFSASPTAFSRSTSGHMRTRTPSNPVSPSGSQADLSFSPIGSPVFTSSRSRPLSRSSSYTPQHFGIFGSSAGGGFGSSGGRDGNDSDDENTINNALLNISGDISSLPMPSSAIDSSSDDGDNDDDNDDDDERDSSLVLDRNTASSTASMEPLERLDALQRTNADLGRKLMEAERTLQNRLGEHESELEEMQSKLEEMRSELSATKREEKELRSKERQNITQISALELEVAKVSKALEHAKSTYTSLQRQYQEQCSFSEKYRDDLRHREELIRSLREAASLHEVEIAKWSREQQSYEERIAHLEEELSVAQGVYAQLDEQKQENLLLKETIDRMRFEMDEMRGSAAALGAGGGGGGGGGTSAGNTISKSLGAELMGKLKWEEEGSEGEEDEDERDRSMETVSEGEGSSVTAVEFDDEGDEDEDVIQTIITRKKRKVASRAKDLNPSTRSHTFHEMEELKEYSDIAIQYDPTLVCVSSGVQTLPPPIIPTASFAAQTDPPRVSTFAIQTDTPPSASPKVEKITFEMEIQTDAQLEVDASTQEGDESLASSSSTILPPTPKAQTRGLPTTTTTDDEPPTYNQVAAQRLEEEKERRVVSEALSRWHLGAKLRSLYSHTHTPAATTKGESSRANVDERLDVEPIKDGVAEDLVEEWKALKEELGVECLVIDKILENSTKIPREPASSSSTLTTAAATDKGKRRSGRFFNIYNTYVYGASDPASSTSTASPPTTTTSTKSIGATLTSLATQTLLFASASAVVFVALTPYIPYLLSTTAPTIPGGASMYDRAAWASFNTLGGGAGEGIAFTAARNGAAGAGAGLAGWFGWGGGLGGAAAGAAGAGAGAMGMGVVGGNGGGGVDGQTTEAVWRVLETVGGGAARMARGWPT